MYIGNWVLNSTRGDDRIKEYDQVESLVFAHCLDPVSYKHLDVYKRQCLECGSCADTCPNGAISPAE